MRPTGRRLPALIAGWLATTAAVAATGAPPAPSVLLELDGRVVRAERADLPRAPGSLAKLLTALALLDSGWDAQRWLPVGEGAAAAEPARAGLRAGDAVRAGDALTALLVHSANDACRVLVESAPGGEAALRARMADLQAGLGLAATRILDPCGFDAPGQQATASDLLRLGQAAWRHAEVRAAAGLRSATLRTRAGRTLHVATSNALLGRVPGVLGLKTGYTAQAGPCVIAIAQANGHVAWLVVLGDADRWWHADAMLRGALQLHDGG